ncbi:MAG TPA: hypothetical protein VF247_08135 [Candidatus Krumholzibacteria bacterium]
MKRTRSMLLLATAVAMIGCSGGTKISDSWKDSALEPKPLGKIAVVGIGDDAVVRRMFEDTFAKALRDRGNDAVASYTFVKAGPDTNPDSLVATLRTAGYEGALTARSLGEETVETQTLGSTYYMPQGYYQWGSYYSMSYGAMMTTSYNERSGRVLIEANLFDLASERLIWAVRSSTTKTAKLKESVNSYTGTVVRELAKSGWIK